MVVAAILARYLGKFKLEKKLEEKLSGTSDSILHGPSLAQRIQPSYKPRQFPDPVRRHLQARLTLHLGTVLGLRP